MVCLSGCSTPRVGRTARTQKSLCQINQKRRNPEAERGNVRWRVMMKRRRRRRLLMLVSCCTCITHNILSLRWVFVSLILPKWPKFWLHFNFGRICKVSLNCTAFQSVLRHFIHSCQWHCIVLFTGTLTLYEIGRVCFTNTNENVIHL